jgi:hypothetical protein
MKTGKFRFGLSVSALCWLIGGVNPAGAANDDATLAPAAHTSSTLPSDMAPSGSALNRGVKHLFPQAVPKGEDDSTSLPTGL